MGIKWILRDEEETGQRYSSQILLGIQYQMRQCDTAHELHEMVMIAHGGACNETTKVQWCSSVQYLKAVCQLPTEREVHLRQQQH
jgi:hypothetical protein